MLDLSPEKLTVLLAVGLVVLGPDKLPAAARSLAQGLARARRMAANLTEPIATLAEPVRSNVTEPLKAGLAEPRRAVDDAVADLRATIAGHPLSPTSATPVPAEASRD